MLALLESMLPVKFLIYRASREVLGPRRNYADVLCPDMTPSEENHKCLFINSDPKDKHKEENCVELSFYQPMSVTSIVMTNYYASEKNFLEEAGRVAFSKG